MGLTALGRSLLAAIAFALAWPGGTGKVVAQAPSCGPFVDGTLMPPLSPDGNVIAYGFNPYLVLYGGDYGDQIYVRDCATGAERLVSVSSTGEAGNDVSERPSVSADGRFVAFQTLAINFHWNGCVHVTTQDVRRTRTSPA